jgi:hypothetical protein
MTDTFYEQAAIARNRYVSFYHRAIDKLKNAPSFAVELLVQPNGRSTPPPFCFSRMDVVHGSAGEPQIKRIADSVEREFQESFTLSDGLEIQQKSFSWEALRLTFSAEVFEIQTVGNWLRKWLDPDEIFEQDPWGLSGVVHDLAWSYNDPGVWCLNLDLGSAPISALEELFRLLSASGIKRIAVSRHDFEDA